MVRDGSAHLSALSITYSFKEYGWMQSSCGDCRALNSHTIRNRYPIRHNKDYFHNIADYKVFSKVDLLEAY